MVAAEVVFILTDTTAGAATGTGVCTAAVAATGTGEIPLLLDSLVAV